jgi:hypothetical protein
MVEDQELPCVQKMHDRTAQVAGTTVDRYFMVK